MNKLLLVDGSNLLFQMFFGMPARIVNAEGKAIQGTLGFTGALLRIIRMTNPTHVAVLFDGEHENERALVNADYKANRIDYSREEETESPFSQLDDVYAALDYLQIRHAETVTCEADDWMASYAHKYGRENEVIIVSFDSDFFQLITKQVSVLRYRGDRSVWCDPAYLMNKYQIVPAQYADFKALTGDQSDNLKGAEHIGPKTASSLLQQFGCLEAILDHTDSIAKPSVRASVIRSASRILDNKRLIQLDGNADVPFTLNELAWHSQEMTTTEVLKGIHLR